MLKDPDEGRASRAMEAMLNIGEIEVDGLRRAADAEPVFGEARG